MFIFDIFNFINSFLKMSFYQKLEKILPNDPTAGSPTITLLRLLLPANGKIYLSSVIKKLHPISSPGHSTGRSDGGVYKGQGRIRRGLMTHPY